MELILLKNDVMEVTLSNLGASIFRILFDKQDMLVTPVSLEDFLKKELYFGKTVGRICGRIKNEAGEIILHGGPQGLSNQLFDYVQEDNKVTFTYLSSGDDSSTGEVLFVITYTLLDNELRIELQASAKEKAIVSLTNHAYFCLGENSNKDLSIQMDSDKYFIYDEELYPIGKDDISKKYNFKELLPVKQYGELDTFFYLNRNPVILKGPRYQLEVETNYDGVVVYTDNFEDDVKTYASPENKYRGVTIEAQVDAFNRKPLLPAETRKRYITYRFTKL